MKVKQFVCINNPINFLKGNYQDCFGIYGDENIPDTWVSVGEIELNVDVDIESMMEKSLAALDAEEEKTKKEFKGKIELLRVQRNNLLCLEAPKTKADNVYDFDDGVPF